MTPLDGVSGKVDYFGCHPDFFHRKKGQVTMKRISIYGYVG